ncbi:MAG: hypothetical protein JO142_01785 [Burkholderiales bacterium]|nr:hypothetical protein [Burkholderiales bacterium]
MAEMAIVIVIGGILLTLGLGVATTQLSNSQRTGTQTNLFAARDTMLGYFAGNHRFPCPDNTRTGLETVVGNGCATAIGTIPYATIGLPKSQAMDAYGNYITYVIDPQRDPAPGRANFWMWTNRLRQDTTLSHCSYQANNVVDSGPRGELRIMQRPGVEETTYSAATPLSRMRAVFVLISHGADGLGAWGPNGVQHTPPPRRLSRAREHRSERKPRPAGQPQHLQRLPIL